MSTSRPFAYNTGSTIAGTIQVGSLAVGTPTSGFTGMEWWNGPDEDLGYVIAISVPSDTQPTPVSGITASVGFNRTDGFNDSEFVSLANLITGESFVAPNQASTGLTSLGYWNSYGTSGISINDYYEGGIVSYIYQPGDPGYVSGETHGMIASLENYTGYSWGCGSLNVSGIQNIIGSGASNQTLIVNSVNTNCPSSASTNAFVTASNLSINGYDDWFIPNRAEWNASLSGTGEFNIPNFMVWDGAVHIYWVSNQTSADFSEIKSYRPDLGPPWYQGTINATAKTFRRMFKPFRYF